MAYASRSVTHAEKNYEIIEKDYKRYIQVMDNNKRILLMIHLLLNVLQNGVS